MISRLFIQNLILIEQAEIEFGPGLNIITGETGSGKSALLSAIRLLLGGKADLQQIRNQAPFAVVEAQVVCSDCLDWLEEEGISIPQTRSISIRREIHRSGKNRCFFEEQQINLSTLKKIIGTSIELVDQSSSLTLGLSDEQRKWLDSFGNISAKVSEFAESFEKERSLQIKLQELLLQQEKADREQQQAEENLMAIEEVNPQEGEEKQLTQDHHFLTNVQQLLETATSTVSLLSESSQPMVSLLKRAAQSLEHLLPFDSRLSEPFETIKRSAIELEEASFMLRSYADRLEADPTRLITVEERLKVLEKLKKRFGPLNEIKNFKNHLLNQLDHISQLDANIAMTKAAIADLRKNNLIKAENITQIRKKAAEAFSKLIVEELFSLNLPHARFEIVILPKELSAQGADAVSFLFTANPGCPLLPIEQCASGGELSRLLLAIKTVLAELEKSTCLIFDEIDSNVGGQTAAIVGSKLQILSKKRQTICVTHFVQVARYAFHHFLVSKNQAVTTIKKLTSAEQEQEFNRMLGQEFCTTLGQKLEI